MTNSFSERILLTLGIFFAVLGSLFPFLWFVLTSLKSQIQVEAIPPTWWPDGSVEFYYSALIDHDLFNYIWNSFIVASAADNSAVAAGYRRRAVRYRQPGAAIPFL